MSRVLIVDDSPVDRRLVGGLLEKAPSIDVEYAADGAEALEAMRSATPKLVVTDLIMPNMDGLELVAAVVEEFPTVPVILMTGKGSESIAVRALKAGAASYVPKSVLAEWLLDTVENVLAVAQEEQTQTKLMDCMIGCRFRVDNDAGTVSALVNFLRLIVRNVGLCDETNSIRTGVALEEALNNALFHGNLELDSDTREGNRSVYWALVEERSKTQPFCDRKIHVEVELTDSEGRFSVRDEGPGFDPKNLPDPTDPANLEKPSGRGLLLMRTFMDEVVFNPAGNQVTLVKKRAT
jgi:CheY-like chemotaxis protein/anti-sigma regulatory factor (Ser/Thr protein kinase)